MLEAVVARPRPARGALVGGAHAAADRRRRRLQPRRRAAAAVGQGRPAPREGARSSQRDEAVLAETGIRVLREKPVFTTPNVFPPAGFEQADVDGRPDVPRGRRAAALLRLQAALRRDPPLLRPAVPGVRRASTSRKRTETADLRGRVALLTGGRVKIGYQAGIKLLRAGAQLIVTTRFPRDAAARYARGARLRRLGRPARDLRARPAPHAERRGVLPAPARDARPARLHRQQRLPDRAPAAGVLPAHAGARDARRRDDAGTRSRGCSAQYEGLRRYDIAAGRGVADARRRAGSSA